MTIVRFFDLKFLFLFIVRKPIVSKTMIKKYKKDYMLA